MDGTPEVVPLIPMPDRLFCPGNPPAANPGNPPAANPRNPPAANPSNPPAVNPGNPLSANPGNPGNPSADNPGNPSAGNPSNPAAGNPGSVPAGNPETPAVTSPCDIKKVIAKTKQDARESIARGLIDFGLLASNSNQLKTLLTIGEDQEFYEVKLTLVVTSLFLQIVAGIMKMAVESHVGFNIEISDRKKYWYNLILLSLVFAVLVVNVFILTFGIAPNDPPACSQLADLLNGNRSA